MNRLTYKTVFAKYEATFSHKLAQKAYSTYRSARLYFSKWYPLKEHERYMLEDHYIPSLQKTSPMPKGFDYSTQRNVEGIIELKYVDFFDYGYRFMSEFSGESIDMGDVLAFRNSLIKDGSFTESCLNGIAENIIETKKQIDVILHLLDDSAEYQTARSNWALQWFMMVVTVLSLIVAVITLTDFQINITNIWTNITDFLKNVS